jgi:hypothetical protein
MADYTADGAVELSFEEGDIIYVLEEIPSGWWKVEVIFTKLIHV